jgi:hypothetical protein
LQWTYGGKNEVHGRKSLYQYLITHGENMMNHEKQRVCLEIERAMQDGVPFENPFNWPIEEFKKEYTFRKSFRKSIRYLQRKGIK